MSREKSTCKELKEVRRRDNGLEVVDTTTESNLPTSLDTIEVVFEPSAFALDGTVSAPQPV